MQRSGCRAPGAVWAFPATVGVDVDWNGRLSLQSVAPVGHLITATGTATHESPPILAALLCLVVSVVVSSAVREAAALRSQHRIP